MDKTSISKAELLQMLLDIITLLPLLPPVDFLMQGPAMPIGGDLSHTRTMNPTTTGTEDTESLNPRFSMTLSTTRMTLSTTRTMATTLAEVRYGIGRWWVGGACTNHANTAARRPQQKPQALVRLTSATGSTNPSRTVPGGYFPCSRGRHSAIAGWGTPGAAAGCAVASMECSCGRSSFIQRDSSCISHP